MGVALCEQHRCPASADSCGLWTRSERALGVEVVALADHERSRLVREHDAALADESDGLEVLQREGEC